MKKLTALAALLGLAFVVVGCDPAPKDEPSATPPATSGKSDKPASTTPEPVAKPETK